MHSNRCAWRASACPADPSSPCMPLVACRSDMKFLIQEACQGPVRDALKANGNVEGVTADALRPVMLRDFQVGGGCGRGWRRVWGPRARAFLTVRRSNALLNHPLS